MHECYFRHLPRVRCEQRRFFYYRTVAKLLGGGGKRVDLPFCVKEKIESLHGDSTTGFDAGEGEDAA